jgi:hypothetical protein
MRLFLVTVGLWALVGCQQKEAGAGAVRVELFYATFRPGCLQVTATDEADASRSETQRLSVESRSGLKTVAVFRQPEWSRQLRVSASAREGSCTGPEVATSTQRVEVPATGTTVVNLDLRAPDVDGDGFVARSPEGKGGTDCDDRDASVYPGAPETCDGKDSNCSGDESDAADPRDYAVDADRDGYCGTQTARGCPPAGPACQPGDCRDNDATVHPGGAESRCDGVDENCNGLIDENFQVGVACETEARCASTWTCTQDKTAAECLSAQTPRAWYSDPDGDGRFGAPVAPLCVQPPGTQPTLDDCDETSRFIGGPEVCDRLDNDCAGGADEGGVCAAIQWTSRTLGGSPAWAAVTTDARGKAWLAGAGGQLLRVEGATGTDRSSICGATHDWTAAWARPRDGRVFLASAQGELATVAPSGAACDVEPLTGLPGALTGLVGFERDGLTTVYAVASSGDIVRWEWRDEPASLPHPTVVTRVAANLRGIHGLGPDALLAVGAEDYQPGGGGALPRVFRFEPASGRWSREALPTDLGTGFLRGVSVVDGQRAYAVGDQGLVLERQGGTWRKLPAPGTADLLDVVAFHPTAVLVLSQQSGVFLHLYNGETWSAPYPQAHPLLSLDALGPTEQWAAGQGGTLVHWGP